MCNELDIAVDVHCSVIFNLLLYLHCCCLFCDHMLMLHYGSALCKTCLDLRCHNVFEEGVPEWNSQRCIVVCRHTVLHHFACWNMRPRLMAKCRPRCKGRTKKVFRVCSEQYELEMGEDQKRKFAGYSACFLNRFNHIFYSKLNQEKK